MAISQKIVNLNDQAYVINAYDSLKGFKLLAKLTKYATPVIAELTKMQEVDSEELDNALAGMDITSMIQNLFLEGTDGFVDLIFALVEDVEKDGQKININKEFKQNYMLLLKVALEVIKFNYADVFQELGMSIE